VKLTTPAYSMLSDTQLLGKLIGVREARRLYRGSLAPLFDGSHDKEITPGKCAVARELVQRWLNEELSRESVLSAPSAVRDCLRIHFAGREYESFIALFLDTQHRLIVAEELFRGTLSETAVYPREIARSALRLNAGSVIFAHNHPNHDSHPSLEDRAMTKLLTKALALIDVAVLDHLVIAPNSTFSFAERKYL